MSFNNAPVHEEIAKHKDILDLVKQLMDIVNNPKLLTSSYDEVRKGLQLTETQASQYQEALDFMSEYEKKLGEYNAKSLELQRAIDSHGEVVKKHNEYAQDKEAAFDAKKVEQDAITEAHKKERIALDGYDKNIRAKEKEVNDKITSAATQITKDRDANTIEAGRLAKLAAKLNKKDQKYKEVLAAGEE